MTNLNDSLPDLMRRATEHLEPTASDLVERGIRRGQVLSRRRTALAGVAGAVAVLATVGIVVAGTQAVGGGPSGHAPFAGTPTTTSSTSATANSSSATATTGAKAKPSVRPAATPQRTLQTLRSLLPAGTRVTKPTTFGDDFIGASYLADDGDGASYVEVLIETEKTPIACPPEHPEFCTTRPDGSLVIATVTKAEKKSAASNYVTVGCPDGRTISLGSANATDYKRADQTRPRPLLSIAQLTAIADSTAWSYPPVGYGKDLNR